MDATHLFPVKTLAHLARQLGQCQTHGLALGAYPEFELRLAAAKRVGDLANTGDRNQLRLQGFDRSLQQLAIRSPERHVDQRARAHIGAAERQ